MRNTLGIYELFGENQKSKELFLNWCRKDDDFCDYDVEKIEIDLYTPSTDNSEMYFHFHYGNILDWLEHQGYFIGLPLRGEFKFITVVHVNAHGNTHQKPLYSNSGVTNRTRALELGVINAINDLEKKL
jgi:hypothetical protein